MFVAVIIAKCRLIVYENTCFFKTGLVRYGILTRFRRGRLCCRGGNEDLLGVDGLNDKELWDRVCQLIQPQMPMVYSFVERNWASLIDNALIQAAGRPVRLQLVHKGEQPELPAQPKTQEADHASSELNPAYTFDTFVVGSANRFAHAACLAVAEAPADAYNPLFLYGGVGLGKTHLMHAIGHFVLNRHPETVVRYVTTETFTNELIEAIQQKRTAEFRDRYRKCDLLLIDDIQFLAKKESTQEEFHNTFNALHDAGKQIVITSDRPPLEMSLLDDRLRTRFEGGLMADIQPPDLETRMAITRNKAAQLGLILSDDAVEYIAENITANIRQIEGVIKRLTAYKEILNDVITIDSVKRAIADMIRTGDNIPKPDNIIRETAKYYSLREEDLRGQSRSKNMAMARQVSMYLMRSLTNLSLKDIGEQYEGRNHATVLSSIRKVEDLMAKDPKMAAIVRDITSNITSNV